MIVKNKYIKRKPNKQRNLQTNILTKIKQIRKPRERDTPFTMLSFIDIKIIVIDFE